MFNADPATFVCAEQFRLFNTICRLFLGSVAVAACSEKAFKKCLTLSCYVVMLTHVSSSHCVNVLVFV